MFLGMEGKEMSKKNKMLIGIFTAILLVVVVIMIVIFISKSNEEELKTYTVKFDSGNGQIIEQIVAQGEMVEQPKSPKKDGYIFIGWKHAGEVFDFSKSINGNVTLVAEWKKVEDDVKVFVVKFNTDGGTTLANQVIEEGNKVEIPDNPVKEGYIFKGWMLDDVEYDFELEVNKDLELTAKWEKKDNVVNGNNSTSNENKEENIKLATPTLTPAGGSPGITLFSVGVEGAYSVAGSTSEVTGWELYEKVGSQYNLVKSQEGFGSIQVTVDIGESKTYVARVYALNKNGKKVYSAYSNEIVG